MTGSISIVGYEASLQSSPTQWDNKMMTRRTFKCPVRPRVGLTSDTTLTIHRSIKSSPVTVCHTIVLSLDVPIVSLVTSSIMANGPCLRVICTCISFGCNDKIAIGASGQNQAGNLIPHSTCANHHAKDVQLYDKPPLEPVCPYSCMYYAIDLF